LSKTTKRNYEKPNETTKNGSNNQSKLKETIRN